MRIIDISLKEVLQKHKGYTDYDFTETKNGFQTNCPIHGGDKFYIYDNTSEGKGWSYYCFSCPTDNGDYGVGGDILDLYIKLGLSPDAKEAIKLIQKEFNLAPPDKWDVRTFAEYKGLNWEFLRDNGWVTEQNGLYVPFYDMDGNIISEKLRHHATSTAKYTFLNGTTQQPYGLQWLKDADKSIIYITEGETDCLTVAQCGLTAVGIPSCNAWNDKFSGYFKNFDKIVVAIDNDDQGKSLLNDMAGSFPDNLYVLCLPYKVKDVNDYHQYVCFSNIDTFKSQFTNLPVFPATISTFIKAAEENKEFLMDRRAWKFIIRQLKNPIKREEIVNSLSKLTKYTKAALNEMIDSVEIGERKLDEWYTVSKHGIDLNPELFAEHLAKEQPIIKVNGLWYLYFETGVYRMVGDEYIIDMIRKNLIPECSKEPKNIKDTLFYLENNTNLIKDYDEFDKDPYIMNVRNGLLNIHTMQLSDHTPTYYSMKQLNVNYSPSVTESDLFKEYLDTKITDSETRTLAQEVLGYSISNFYEAEKWFLIWGRGRSGKGTFLNIINSVLGTENVSSIALQNLGERFNKASLFGRLANIDGDLSKGYLNDDAIKTLKSCIGRDFISAEFKGKDVFKFVNKATMIFACNDLPQNTGDNKNASFWEKLVLLKFDNSDTENVKTSFKYDLVKQENLDYIFLWALDGLKRLLENDFVFSNCTASGELKQTYKRHSSSAIQFVDERGTVGDESSTFQLSDDFMRQYEEWCKINNRMKKQPDQIISDLVEYYKGTPICRKKVRRGGDKNPRWYFLGVQLDSEF